VDPGVFANFLLNPFDIINDFISKFRRGKQITWNILFSLEDELNSILSKKSLKALRIFILTNSTNISLKG
jgi:hypothetical protein